MRATDRWTIVGSALAASALVLLPGTVEAQAMTFGDGVHVVGTDVAPGTYRAPGGATCYWARLSGFEGSAAEIIADATVTGPALITIEPSDAGVRVSGCGDWTAAVEPSPGLDPAVAQAVVFGELRATDTSLDVGYRSFVNRWNDQVRGQGRRFRIASRPTMRLDDAGMRYYDVRPEIDAREGDSSTSIGLRAYLQSDDRVRTAGLEWLPQAASSPAAHADRLNALILMEAFVAGVDPRLDEDHGLMGKLGWPEAEEVGWSFEGFQGSVAQQTWQGVVYTLAAFADDEGRDVVWLTARREERSHDP